MSSNPGLPTRGLKVAILITRVQSHAHCVPVEFWAKFSQAKTAEYERLAKDIQSPGKKFKDFEGNPGDQCLAQVNGTWYRSRIVSKHGSKYKVFLFDQGTTCSTTTNQLSWGQKDHFCLLPEVEFCVLANVLPISPENGWTPVAVEFLKSLSGRSVMAHVQDILAQQRTFLLHVPCISKQMYEMGFAKKLSPENFKDFIMTSLQSDGGADVSPELKPLTTEAGEPLHKQGAFMYPQHSGGTLNTVIVTEVRNPEKIFCQLKVFSFELKKLSEELTHCCEVRMSSCIIGPEMIGFPCAARGMDGKWYRSVLLQVFPAIKLVEVLNVDYGSKKFVKMQNIRSLAAEFFRMPVVTYICSLSGVICEGEGWTSGQIEYLKFLLLFKTVNAKFDYKNITEGIHHVTLYLDDNTTINSLFGSKDSHLLKSKINLADSACHRQLPAMNGSKTFSPGQAAKDQTLEAVAEKPPAEDLPGLNSSLMTGVQHVSNPSELWIQTQNLAQPDPSKVETANMPPTHPNAELPGMSKTIGTTFQTQNPVLLPNSKRIKEQRFLIGSVIDVCVSYIKSPKDFWCQLVSTNNLLEMLMHDMQAHYADSESQPIEETACVAQHPENRMWYRATVIRKYDSPQVDVLFIDYGHTETVTLSDLRKIHPKFLGLPGQAFRCSLLHPSHPTTAMPHWKEEAVESFQNFVETAESNFGFLKCTIYAGMINEQNIVFNIVDLETPFESVLTSMVKFIKHAPPKMPLGESFQLSTYYYSAHNVKTGTEDKVTVTCVISLSKFYCQLEKNTDVLEDLQMKVNKLCLQLEHVKVPAVFGSLCFAKYTDGCWYRGQIKATAPKLLVQFVDFGDIIHVARSDLLPVPKEANDIMSVPVQAMLCGLSDFPDTVPSEANSWFEKNATLCKFRALVVAREPDGKMLVELCYRNTQVNTKIKKMFHIQKPAEQPAICHGQRAPEMTKATPKQASDLPHHKPPLKENNFSASKPCYTTNSGTATDKIQQPAVKSAPQDCDNGQRLKSDPLKLFIQQPQRQPAKRMPRYSSQPAGAQVKQVEEHLKTDVKQLIKSELPATKIQKETNVEHLPRLADLPFKHISPHLTADVHVSHCNSPLSFYVQFAIDEDQILSLTENLNDPQSTPKTSDIKGVHPGDLVQAEFADDSSWYRAVVKEVFNDAVALVEFVDFGNTEKIPLSKINRLHESFLHSPIYSTHCRLSAFIGKETVLDPKVVSAFKESVGEKILKCQFIRQTGSVWEVSLTDNGVTIPCLEALSEGHEKMEEVPDKTTDSRQVSVNPQKSLLTPCPLQYTQVELSEGQQLQVYITFIIDAQTFWCQFANSEELDKIALRLEQVEHFADQKCLDPGALLPGSPCIALYSSDQFWYRAEVIDKEEEELNVLFVDYGNSSKVNISEVREMPQSLVKFPPQAFLCELEGFDTLHGSWDSSAANKLATLTMEKLLKLTVTRTTRAEEKTKRFVHVECDNQVINEAMKAWWKCVPTEEESTYEAPLEQDLIVNQISSPKDLPEQPDDQEVDCSGLCSHPNKDHDDLLPDFQTEDNICEVPSTTDGCSEESVHIKDSAESSKEESASTDLANVAPAGVTSPKEMLQCDSGVDETLLVPLDDNDDQGGFPSSVDMHENTCHDLQQENTLGLNTVGAEDFSSQLSEDLVEVVVESETTVKEVADGGYNPDILSFSDSAVKVHGRKDDYAMSASRTGTTAARMVPQKAVSLRRNADHREAAGIISGNLQQIQAEFSPDFLLLAGEQLSGPTEPNDSCEATRAGEDSLLSDPREEMLPQEEVDPEVKDVLHQMLPDQLTEFQNEAFEAASANVQGEDSQEQSALPSDPEPQTCTVESPFLLSSESLLSETLEEMLSQEEVDPEVKDVLHQMLADHLTEFQNEAFEASSAHVRDEDSSLDKDSLTAAALAVCEEEQSALPSDPEPQTCTTKSQFLLSSESLLSGDSLLSETWEEMLPEVKEVFHPMLADQLTEIQNEAFEASSANVRDEESSLDEDNLTPAALAVCEEEQSALPSDPEPQTCTAESLDLTNLVEEVTCLVGEIRLTDVCQETEAEMLTEDSEQ